MLEGVLGVALDAFEKEEVEDAPVLVAVEGVEFFEVFGGKLEVEEGDVGFDSVGVATLGDDDDVLLDEVAQEDLAGGLLVFFGEGAHAGVAQNVGKVVNAEREHHFKYRFRGSGVVPLLFISFTTDITILIIWNSTSPWNLEFFLGVLRTQNFPSR